MSEPGSREKDAFENDKGWLAKSARPFVVEAVETLKPQLADCYGHIEKIRLENSKQYFLYQQLIPHLSLIHI